MTKELIYTYNLVNSKGNKLQLQLACVPNAFGNSESFWRFIGDNVPRPLYSNQWYSLFTDDEGEMLDWCKENEWYLHSRVDMHTYEVIFNLIVSKGNEDCFNALIDAIQKLCRDNHRNTANMLYASYCDCSVSEARDAVRVIIGA